MHSHWKGSWFRRVLPTGPAHAGRHGFRSPPKHDADGAEPDHLPDLEPQECRVRRGVLDGGCGRRTPHRRRQLPLDARGPLPRRGAADLRPAGGGGGRSAHRGCHRVAPPRGARRGDRPHCRSRQRRLTRRRFAGRACARTGRPSRDTPGMRLDSLKCIVSGGAQGMGRHFALRLAEAGGQVAVGDVNVDGLAETVALARSAPGKIHARALDVTQEADIQSFVGWAHQAMGGLNALINNAGILRDALLVKRDRTTGQVSVLSREHWDAVIAVNLTGATFLTREAVRKMVETDTRPGVVVNLASIARHGNRGQSNYVAAKAALAANTLTWAREFAPFGIRVGAVAPGMIDTPMTRSMNPKAREALVAAIPVGRIGVPEDVWQAVKFVLECDYFDGRTVDVDGGLSM